MSSIYGNIDDLYLFCAVVEHGSLMAAAGKLNLPISTMSRRLSGLEERLNIRLLEKHGRELVATQSGQQAFEMLSSGMEQVEIAVADLLSQANEVQGHFKLALPHNFYQSFVGHVIETFLANHPKVRFDLILSQQQVIPQTDRDLLITFDVSPVQDMVARPLFTARHGFFASPEFLAQHDNIETASDMAQLDWICVDQIREVPIYQDKHLVETLTITPKLVVNDIRAVVRAVESGLGIASLPFRHVSQEMNLVRLFPHYHRSDRQAYLVYKQRKYQPKALMLLIEALLEGVNHMILPTSAAKLKP